jgi:hypothetical protein
MLIAVLEVIDPIATVGYGRTSSLCSYKCGFVHELRDFDAKSRLEKGGVFCEW